MAQKDTASQLASLSPEQLALITAIVDAAKGSGSQSSELTEVTKQLAEIAKTNAAMQQDLKEQRAHSNTRNLDDRDPIAFDSRCAECRAGQKHANGEYKHPKPALKYEVFFCHTPQRHGDLTPLEIELYNNFNENREARGGLWKATFSQNGTRRRLEIKVPYESADLRMALPPLAQILLELLHGAASVDPMQLGPEVLALRARVAELEAKAAAPAA